MNPPDHPHDSERVVRLVDPAGAPPHLGELIRESMDELGWNVVHPLGPAGAKLVSKGNMTGRARRMAKRR